MQDYGVNLRQVILWQYEGAPNIRALVESAEAWLNDANGKFWRDWTRDVFDLRTANGFGLMIWARLLELPITILDETPIFGFGPLHANFGHGTFGRVLFAPPSWGFGPARANFGAAGFGRPIPKASPVYQHEARRLLFARWIQITSRPNAEAINRALIALFDAGAAYVYDEQRMIQSITFLPGVYLSARMRALVKKLDLIPRAAGVRTRYRFHDGRIGFGFGPANKNFSNGSFPTQWEYL